MVSEENDILHVSALILTPWLPLPRKKTTISESEKIFTIIVVEYTPAVLSSRMSSQGSFTPTFRKKPYPAISPLRPELSAASKTVLITGGSKGIGAAIAKSFAQANATNIIILGRTQSALDATKSEIEGLGTKSKVHAVVADVSNAKKIDEVFATITKDIAPINIFVSNAAGASNFTTPIKDIPIEEFWSDYEINVKGALIVTQAFLKNCVKEGAVYLNISAAAAHVKYVGKWAPYTSSKMAFLKVMDHVEMQNPWLRVHNIHPGVFKTGLTTDLETDDGKIPDDFWEDSEYIVYLQVIREESADAERVQLSLQAILVSGYAVQRENF